jgi:hypothetical protein
MRRGLLIYLCHSFHYCGIKKHGQKKKKKENIIYHKFFSRNRNGTKRNEEIEERMRTTADREKFNKHIKYQDTCQKRTYHD